MYNRSLLHDEDARRISEDWRESDLIVRLEEGTVDDRDAQAFGGKRVGCLEGRADHRAGGEQSDFGTMTENFPRPVRHRLDLGDWWDGIRSGVAWIANRERTLLVLDGGAQQTEHLASVLGSRHGDVRHGEQIGDVVQPHVRLAVLADEPSAIEAEHDGKRLDRDVVDDAVVGPLQEGRVDRDHRAYAPRCESGGKRNRVALGDADVEKALRVGLRE